MLEHLKNYTIDSIAKMICNFTNLSPSRIEYLSDKPKGIFRRPIDNSKFVSISNFKYTKLSEGIERTCKWLNSNYGKIL